MEINELLRDYGGIRLDIGCGANKQPGFFGMDQRALAGVDLVWDIEDTPWPLPDGCALVAVMSHVFEHVKPWRALAVLDEVWRVLRPGGQLALIVPHGHSEGYLQDPTHCNACNENTFAYFDPAHPSGLWQIYQPKPWRIEMLASDPTTQIEVVLRKVEEGAG